ncbi:MAG: Tol-Pal system subunit TolQ, partial [Proteobacteria bacterium]|nr:Tol-Pal system subunit TolQ [Pseudomonadota bacterium]
MTTETIGLFYMLSDAGPVVKFIMLLLLFFSITSWAIMFIKFRYIHKAFKESAEFTDIFWQCRNLADAFSKAKALRSSPLARMFIAGYMEMARSETPDKQPPQIK